MWKVAAETAHSAIATELTTLKTKWFNYSLSVPIILQFELSAAGGSVYRVSVRVSILTNKTKQNKRLLYLITCCLYSTAWVSLSPLSFSFSFCMVISIQLDFFPHMDFQLRDKGIASTLNVWPRKYQSIVSCTIHFKFIPLLKSPLKASLVKTGSIFYSWVEGWYSNMERGVWIVAFWDHLCRGKEGQRWNPFLWKVDANIRLGVFASYLKLERISSDLWLIISASEQSKWLGRGLGFGPPFISTRYGLSTKFYMGLRDAWVEGRTEFSLRIYRDEGNWARCWMETESEVRLRLPGWITESWLNQKISQRIL